MTQYFYAGFRHLKNKKLVWFQICIFYINVKIGVDISLIKLHLFSTLPSPSVGWAIDWQFSTCTTNGKPLFLFLFLSLSLSLSLSLLVFLFAFVRCSPPESSPRSTCQVAFGQITSSFARPRRPILSEGVRVLANSWSTRANTQTNTAEAWTVFSKHRHFKSGKHFEIQSYRIFFRFRKRCSMFVCGGRGGKGWGAV